MSKKTLCDGCGCEIKEWKAGDPNTGYLDGIARSVRLNTGTNHQQWDLCDPCQGKIADALVDLLPGTPRESWWNAIRPSKATS